VLCKSSSFPCSAANTAGTVTASVNADGTWDGGPSSALTAVSHWAQATQGTSTSAPYGPFTP
jgi:hypothetical protein